jgi:L-fucose isomerase-like protein
MYGQSVKAGFALYTIMGRYLRDNKEKLCRLALRNIAYDQERIMRSSFEKMIRAAGLNMERSWLSWKMYVQSRNHGATKLAKRNISAANIGKVLDKKRKNQMMAGVKRLADGVAKTNA